MKVTTDAVQVLGGNNFTRVCAAERCMRQAEVMQLFERTNQIQRLVISRGLTSSTSRTPDHPRERGAEPVTAN